MDEATNQLASDLWELGGVGALGEIVAELFALGRTHHALELLRTLSEPAELRKVQRLAASELNNRHTGMGELMSWALAQYGDQSMPPPTQAGPTAEAQLEAILDSLLSSQVRMSEGLVDQFVSAAHLNARLDLVAAVKRHQSRQSIDAQSGSVGGVLRSPVSGAPDRHRAAPTRPVDVALAFDRRLAPYAQLAMATVVDTSDSPIRFHILTRDVARTELLVLAERLATDIRVHDVADHEFGGATPLSHIHSNSTFDRLLLPQLLQDVDRVVYLDADLLVFDDIASVASWDLRHSAIAARPLLHGNATVGAMVEQRQALMPDLVSASFDRWLGESGAVRDSALFNAGVMVMDLKQMRTDTNFLAHLSAMSAFRLDDQDTLCIYGSNGFSELPRRWNVLASMEVVASPAIIHFAGARKPWTHFGVAHTETWQDCARTITDSGRMVWPVPGLRTSVS